MVERKPWHDLVLLVPRHATRPAVPLPPGIRWCACLLRMRRADWWRGMSILGVLRPHVPVLRYRSGRPGAGFEFRGVRETADRNSSARVIRDREIMKFVAEWLAARG